MILDDDLVVRGGFPNDGIGGLTAGITYRFKNRSFRTAPKQIVLDEMAAANLVLANQVAQLQNRPPEIKVVEKEVVKKEVADIYASIPSTIPFKFNSAVIQDVYEPLIYNIGTFLKQNPKAKIRVVGYADKFGPINVNLKISEERANAVANMLKKIMESVQTGSLSNMSVKKNRTTRTTINGTVAQWSNLSTNKLLV